MNERRMKASQRKLVQQRDEARIEIERLKAGIYRLSQPVEVLVASRVASAQAKAQRDAALSDIDHVVSQRLGAKEQELIELHLKLGCKETACSGLESRVAELEGLLRFQAEAIAENELRGAEQAKELASLKMVDAKELRKRIQAKTGLLNSAERAIHSYQRVLKRLCQNGHRDAVMVALDGESTAARLGEVEMEPLMRGVCGNCNNPAVQLLRVNPMGPSGPPVCRDCHKELASAAQEVDADRSAG